MKKYSAYLIDLDGTMYRGNERVEAAAEFVEALHRKGIPYLFLTNNSSKTQAQIAEKLSGMGIRSTQDSVFTSSMATAKYIKQLKKDARCFVIGEEGLIDAIQSEDLLITDDDADFVVVGIDRDINYEKLAAATLAVRNGASFISTNSDIAIPTERGLVPGNGALTAVITVSTGKEPIFIGKPEKIITNEALTALGFAKEQTLMVGDNYHTDILAGIRAGIDTLMVFTGVTPFEDFPKMEKKPTYHVQNLSEWMDYI
ncbi:TIGR01457 family HAD-type hydrolase [Virgibacillus dakarensis]|uniref:Acid sugar phosphatase n=1 Tax=Lentibacillus populi TaxID=1827502 RepID=A0A9W5TW16_9BACI|nr:MULTISPECIES: TIGR01457 family HAD-type hydrolase [Bacillaceae]MBT2217096.1 TIGR01457 family HAD-type hydrolase [Virgibacillus dakarensis]MTW84692.1 TIGR01457 family HAD-type hydrolase [Virgibacillus dakarensis]GGB36579.1 acid sugar phosphatase [Lentibacillus populi]